MADIVGCAINPAVTVDGGTLHMDGYSISNCAGVDGVHLIGNTARIEEGVVSGCQDGVLVAGNGNHRIEYVRVEDNIGTGFRVTTSGNRFEYVSTKGNQAGWNIDIGADSNDIKYSISFEDLSPAYVGGDANDFRESMLAEGPTGLQIDGDNNELRDCALVDAPAMIAGDSNDFKWVMSIGDGTATGFDISGATNDLERSRMVNHDKAIVMSGLSNDVDRMTITDSNTTGVQIDGNSNEADRSFIAAGTISPGVFGVDATSGSMFNSVEYNTIIGHSAADLSDADPTCLNNTWQNNVEGSKSPACLN